MPGWMRNSGALINSLNWRPLLAMNFLLRRGAALRGQFLGHDSTPAACEHQCGFARVVAPSAHRTGLVEIVFASPHLAIEFSQTERREERGVRSKGIQILAVALLMAGSAAAQDYPSRPIRMIVPSPPGGSVDMLARSIGPRLSERWGQQVVIDNRSGAGGVIAAETTAKAPPDGYTLIMATIAAMATNVSLARNLPYDPVRDFAPVTLVASQQLVLLANSAFAAKSVQELIQLAKAKPGQIAYAS